MIRERLEWEVDAYERLGHPNIIGTFLLKTGVERHGQPLPDGFRRGKARLCFMNAAKLVDAGGVRYCEGYAMHPDIGFAFLHAWNVVDGIIVDVTLDTPAEYEYIGVEIPNDVLYRELVKNKTYGLFVSEYGRINIELLKALDPTFEIPNVTRAALPAQGDLTCGSKSTKPG